MPQADTAFLEAARSLQTTLLVNDEGLAEVINEKAREDVEESLQRAFKVMEARTEKRDISLAIQVVLGPDLDLPGGCESSQWWLARDGD